VLVTLYHGLQLALSKTLELVTLNIVFSVVQQGGPHNMHFEATFIRFGYFCVLIKFWKNTCSSLVAWVEIN
jgi:hypothetical protein